VLGLPAPDVDPEIRRLPIPPLAVLLDALGDRHPQVGHGGAVVGEAQLWVLDQVADDGGVVVACHQILSVLVLSNGALVVGG
jgi:hypothetical protein